jgi:hypothetical protein
LRINRCDPHMSAAFGAQLAHRHSEARKAIKLTPPRVLAEKPERRHVF